MLVLIHPALAREAAGEIVSVLGTVEVMRDGRWQAIKAGETLAVGEVARTGEGSRVAIQLADGSQIKLNANSQLELKQIVPRAGLVPTSPHLLQSILRLLGGEIWVRNNGEPLEIQTVPVTATIRGTEFNLALGPSELARLTVLDGLVEFSNPQGSVLVATNEQAMARLGEPPRKTVLLDPLDAVQWSLYYPGLVSFRDFPLSAIESIRQPQPYAARPSPPPTTSTLTPNDLIEQGERNFDLGKRGAARQAFTQALQIDPRSPRVRTGLGWIELAEGETTAALAHFRQARPPTLMTFVGTANTLSRLGRFAEADQVIAEAKTHYPRSPMPWIQAALNDLVRGRVAQAQQALDQALARDPNSALAHGLRSNIYLVQNRKEQALAAARQAVTANPSSPTAYLSLSLAKQAEFNLEDALRAARQAVELDPENPLALIQESRLLFGMGRTQEAFEVAKQARQLAAQEALVNSTWGFLQLARGRVPEAKEAFRAAIAQDSTLGEPHLGIGLALFRKNKTAAAIDAMRKATLLESKTSLYHSYLGKAFFEIKQDSSAQKSLALAKQLDPQDPTPYFYEAIRLQTINRPVEAVWELQKSIELNDNRAVYRSRLLLDEDLATRDASLARIYEDLGFTQLARGEAAKSLGLDPTNYSAHRFLSDSHANRPRHEIARVSELLQAQLLQPININPVQPSLNEINLNIIAGMAPPSFNEYTSLFERDRLQLLVSGVGGNQATLGSEMVLSGLAGPLSYSFGQFHYQTDGFRDNADFQHDIYNAFVQFAATPQLNLQAEYRWRKTEQGDLGLRFDERFNPDERLETRQETARLGAHFAAAPHSDVLVSVFHGDRDEKPTNPEEDSNDRGYQLEAQYLFRADRFNWVIGLGGYDIDHSCLSPCLDFTARQHNAYLYANLAVPNNAIWTFGLGYSALEQTGNQLLDLDSVNPKFGVQWNVADNVRLRLAALKTLKPRLVVEQTIEPSQVAGFNQFFDEPNGTTAESYGAGLDLRLSANLYAGVELIRRDLDIPTFNINLNDFDFLDGRQQWYLGYLYWTPHPDWAIRAEYRLDKFLQSGALRLPAEFALLTGLSSIPGAYQVDTVSIPLTVRYFRSSGLFGELGATYVHQKVEKTGFLSPPDLTPLAGKENFILLDAAVGYRLPKRWGSLSLEAKNILNEHFRYEDISRQLTPETGNLRFIPERSILARFALNF